ncbi:MAG: acetyl-CoA carboxylase biotin carboxyl carrier protein subunit [Fulvivirga sp.]|uniref:acetyl-CoA carboxylase biotin carboxyl carrier protein subunit n=1 Tax=Fulvivirga sp. TaxID=1931237 RepID=UPI0032EFFEDB
MYKASISDKNYQVNISKDKITVDDKSFEWDIAKIDDRLFHIIKDDTAYRAEILSVDKKEKVVLIKLNGKKIEVSLQDKLDLLLEKLGLDNLADAQVNDIKAPMPGLILEINVKEGDEVNKGDTIMILEAMKMENVLKSPGDGVIKAIKVSKGDSVEKNQVLVQF